MIPQDFPEANTTYLPPAGMDESQVARIHAYRGNVEGTNLDGYDIVVTAWKPTPRELQDLIDGGSVYLTICGTSLPPHNLSTRFPE